MVKSVRTQEHGKHKEHNKSQRSVFFRKVALKLSFRQRDLFILFFCKTGSCFQASKLLDSPLVLGNARKHQETSPSENVKIWSNIVIYLESAK